MKKVFICLLISLVAALLLISLSQFSFFRILELKLYDLRMNLRDAPVQDNRIVYVDMDEEAIETLGRWPWPRNVFAHMIDVLKSLGAKQILFDVTFSQPAQIIVDKTSLKNMFQGEEQILDYVQDISKGIAGNAITAKKDILYDLDQLTLGFKDYVDITRQRLQYALQDNDELLAQALSRQGVFIGYSFEIITDDTDIQRYKRFAKLKKEMPLWVSQRPQAPFKNLPPELNPRNYFDHEEIFSLWMRSRMKTLMEKNIQISLKDVAQALKENPERIRPSYNLAKKQLITDKIKSVLDTDPDSTLADIIYHYEIFDTSTQAVFKQAWNDLMKINKAVQKFSLDLPPNLNSLIARRMDPPYVKFTEAVSGGGFLNGIPHQDGILRFVPLFVNYEGHFFPHIGLASILQLTQPSDISFIPSKYLILKGASVKNPGKDIKIPINEKGTMLINWVGRWKDTFKHISGSEIYRIFYLREFLKENKDNEEAIRQNKTRLKKQEKDVTSLVKDSICIIGLTAAGTHDYNPIPYEATYPMVGTHGNVINSILTEQFLTKLSRRNNIYVLLGLSLLLGTLLPFLSSLGGLIITVLISAMICLFSLYLFNKGLWIDLASPLFLCFFSYLGTLSYKFAVEEKDKRQIKKAFAKYVPKDIIEEITKDPSKLKLGGVKKTVTVLFSDIRDFTTYSEKRQPEEIVSILNEYLDAMTQVIFNNKGCLDKYVGDEIMALFGAPNFEPPEQSAKRAVIAAIQMLERLEQLQRKWTAEGLEQLDIGIGINTGEMIVGNMGSNLKMDYTVIGDAVNLGSRIEALTRQYDSHLIISEFVYPYVKDIAVCEPLEAIKVKGKDIPVMIYNVTGLKSKEMS